MILGQSCGPGFAAAAGVRDDQAFEHCLSDSAAIPSLALDTADGNRLGVRVTPTLLINNLEVRGAPHLESLEHLIALGAKRENRE